MSTCSGDNQLSPIDDSSSFWEIGQFRKTIKRMGDGYRLSTELTVLISERAEIEKKYAKMLKHWSKKWNDLIDKGPEYGTIKSAWKAALTEADSVCEVHMQMENKLMNEVHSNIKMWQKENYHKKMMNGFKEVNEAEEGFRKAQKQWAKLYRKLQETKKHFHSCCKQEKGALLQEQTANGDSALSPDAVKKIQDKVAKCQLEVEKTKEKYEHSLEELTAHNPRYMEDMSMQFEKTQDFEKKRLDFFKTTLTDFHRVLDLSNNPDFSQLYRNYIQTIQNADGEKDLMWWKNNYGTGMAMNWPVFEDWSEELHAISKKSVKGTLGGSGGDNVAISSYRSTSEYSNHDYNDPTFSSLVERDKGDASARFNLFTESAARRSRKESSNNTEYPGYTQHTDYNYGNGQTSQDGQDGTMEDGDDLDEGEEVNVRVRACYNYEHVEDDELDLTEGEIFTMIREKDVNGWCVGIKNGVRGLYPADYAVPAD
ncbi:protein kinase C and casein kinase substrate in neurons protein 2-like isoform X2 [Amphiura filiformis]|uniref:protein kinase C and casein kinase substrate in neurons protein 2-like isoform X2 n=1 Tax=Amphiura filiformis TaxID=82378 RepID=UPI003B21AFDA